MTELRLNNTYHQTKVEILYQTYVEITCQWLEGNPKENANYVFYKDDDVIGDCPNDDVCSIGNIQKSDSGVYGCTVCNAVGTSSISETTVTVVCKYDISVPIFLCNYQFKKPYNLNTIPKSAYV